MALRSRSMDTANVGFLEASLRLTSGLDASQEGSWTTRALPLLLELESCTALGSPGPGVCSWGQEGKRSHKV